MEKDVIIIGAGAAGLMCAVEAGKRKRSVIILEHNEKTGKKIRISGGGHCNFTNVNVSHENYISQNPHFCKSALARFTPDNFIALLKRHKIKYHEKEKGRLFCKGTSAEILGMLKVECGNSGVEMLFNCKIKKISKKHYFIVSTNLGMFESESLVIASGGLSYPALGATNFGHKISKQFGLKITPLKPALVPFIFNGNDRENFQELSGISLKTIVSCNGLNFADDILFTRDGLSGPAILQISSYWNPRDVIKINLLPELNAYELFASKKQGKMEMHNLLSMHMPNRFAKKWCELYIESKPICRYSDKELENIAGLIHNWEIRPEGTEGYKKAEATAGGIDTDELSSKTMESKKVPGLYFIGEVVDVTGQLGGYNLHWAWASGYAAGQYA